MAERKQKRISIVIPAYNEELKLERSMILLTREMDRLGCDYEIIISEDGSTDRTAAIARNLRSDRVRSIHSESRNGKGNAIRTASLEAEGDFVIFMDADLASNPKGIKDLICELDNGSAMVIGSRYVAGSSTRRHPVRLIASKGFNWLVRVLLGSKIKDHQCGFKAFRKDKVLPVIKEIESTDWFWDTELLVRLQRQGLSAKEVPIEWDEKGDSKFRLFQDTYNMAKNLIGFKIRHG